MLADIQCTVKMEEILLQLIINWDQTAKSYVLRSHWMMAMFGLKREEVACLNDKRQITPVFGCTLTGDFLLVQVITKGRKTGVIHMPTSQKTGPVSRLQIIGQIKTPC